MNLVGSSSTQEQLVGGCDSLPNITSWQSLVIEDGEGLAVTKATCPLPFTFLEYRAVGNLIWHLT